jgi:hypothetical protein
MFSTSDWRNMSIDERKQALQEVENAEAVSQGRQPLSISFPDMDFNLCGQYYKGTNIEEINSVLVASDSPDEALATVYHEGRHAYQYEQSRNPETADNPELAKAWGENFDDYHDIYDKWYREQPVENDAYKYEEARMQEYYQGENRMEERSNYKAMSAEPVSQPTTAQSTDYEAASSEPVYQPNTAQSTDYEKYQPEIITVEDSPEIHNVNAPENSYDYIGGNYTESSSQEQSGMTH